MFNLSKRENAPTVQCLISFSHIVLDGTSSNAFLVGVPGDHGYVMFYVVEQVSFFKPGIQNWLPCGKTACCYREIGSLNSKELKLLQDNVHLLQNMQSQDTIEETSAALNPLSCLFTRDNFVVYRFSDYLGSATAECDANLTYPRLTSVNLALYAANRAASTAVTPASGNAGGAGINLRNRNLRGAELKSACLVYADLSGADLTGSDLAGANLTGANLTDADLCYVDLSYANLTRANLTRAYLACADLACTNLTEANLTDADLTNANLIGAICPLPRAFL